MREYIPARYNDNDNDNEISLFGHKFIQHY